jgi:ABC-type branched-subunit amino acid transport system permease subunit
MISDARLAAVREIMVGLFLVVLIIFRPQGILPEKKIKDMV